MAAPNDFEGNEIVTPLRELLALERARESLRGGDDDQTSAAIARIEHERHGPLPDEKQTAEVRDLSDL